MKSSASKAHLRDFAVVDLFCGVGGLTNGFKQAGFSPIVGIDFDHTCRFAYEANNTAKFVHADVAALTAKQLLTHYPAGKRKIMIGCAPCQPYSIFNQKKKRVGKDVDDPRWGLLYAFSELIRNAKPEVVSMENVPLLAKFKEGVLLRDFIRRLEDEHYYVSCDIVDAQDYGVPQRRQRLVLIASQHGHVGMPDKRKTEKPISVRQAIGSLPPIAAGEVHHADHIHRSRRLTDLSKERIRATPEGGSWKDWADDLKLECHKNPGGSKYGSVYGRMRWDDVSPTITTYCMGINNGRFGHPSQDRAISLREAALLQSFPKDYKFHEPSTQFNIATVAKHIGNAVPPMLGFAIAEKIKQHLNIASNE